MASTPANIAGQGNPLDSLLAGYASGGLAPPLRALVESHLVLRPASRAFVAALEAAGGEAIDQATPIPLRDHRARLAEILAQDPGAEVDEMSAPDQDTVLPGPLRAYIGRGLSDIRFRWVMPGLSQHRFAEAGVSLLWAKAGTKLPMHTHRGLEVTLVLKGAFNDPTGRFERGDIEIGDADLDHQPIVDRASDCICFVVAEGALRLTGPLGRFIDRFQSR